jgi:hypothetical protein
VNVQIIMQQIMTSVGWITIQSQRNRQYIYRFHIV